MFGLYVTGCGGAFGSPYRCKNGEVGGGGTASSSASGNGSVDDAGIRRPGHYVLAQHYLQLPLGLLNLLLLLDKLNIQVEQILMLQQRYWDGYGSSSVSETSPCQRRLQQSRQQRKLTPHQLSQGRSKQPLPTDPLGPSTGETKAMTRKDREAGGLGYLRRSPRLTQQPKKNNYG